MELLEYTVDHIFADKNYKYIQKFIFKDIDKERFFKKITIIIKMSFKLCKVKEMNNEKVSLNFVIFNKNVKKIDFI